MKNEKCIADNNEVPSVLITGGAGFIGSHLTRRCVSLGWNVQVVDDLSGAPDFSRISDCRDLERGAEVFRDDFAASRILEFVEAGCYDVVFHMAARARVPYSVEHPVESHSVNVDRSLRLIEACRRGRVKRVVFSSSSSVYGGAAVLPTPESEPMRPRSPYALQKSIIEDYLRMYWSLYGLDSVCLRYFNVFGPGQLGDSPYSTAVAAWLTAIGNRTALRSDGDGTQSRDMCYVDNVVDANIAAALHCDVLRGMPINVACGKTHTNNEILEWLAARYSGLEISHAPFRAGDVHTTQADVTRLQEVLHVTPSVLMWDGLERTATWHESMPGWSAKS